MKYYELTYLISPEVDEKKANELHEKIVSFLQDKEAILDMGKEKIKKIELAYPIKKENSAWLASVSFYLTADKIKEVDEKIKSEKSILRYLIISKKKILTHVPSSKQREKYIKEKTEEKVISKNET